MENFLDPSEIHLSAAGMQVMNVSLAIIMYGIALNLKTDDFLEVSKAPKSAIWGVLSQFVYLPFITFLFILFLGQTVGIHPAFALGMVLVAACPGGNVSNFFSWIAGANAALSVSLTAIATIAALFFTPFNFSFWAAMLPETADLMRELQLSFFDVFKTVLLILALPVVLGMITRHYFPNWSTKASQMIKYLGVVLLLAFTIGAIAMNYAALSKYISQVVFLVIAHNFLAIGGGYLIGYLAGLPEIDRRTLAIETGIQNSGLALVLLFTFFNGAKALAPMALVAACWGIWHMIAGAIVSTYWAKNPVQATA